MTSARSYSLGLGKRAPRVLSPSHVHRVPCPLIKLSILYEPKFYHQRSMSIQNHMMSSFETIWSYTTISYHQVNMVDENHMSSPRGYSRARPYVGIEGIWRNMVLQTPQLNAPRTRTAGLEPLPCAQYSWTIHTYPRYPLRPYLLIEFSL